MVKSITKDSSRNMARIATVLVAMVASLISLAPTSVSSLTKWSLAQWMPRPFYGISLPWQQQAWSYWNTQTVTESEHEDKILPIPTVRIQDFHNAREILTFIEKKYGQNWRKKPLLLKGLWDTLELRQNTSRRLSQQGLLREELPIPYFKDARLVGALTPDGTARVKDILSNITQHGAPHKIGTQLLVESYPDLINEVAPAEIVTALFGDRFQPHHVEGAFGLSFLPALTTVPVFVASARNQRKPTTIKKYPNQQEEEHQTHQQKQEQPFTALHCEPIGNVAVQLEGQKQWTLVSPEYSFRVKPAASPDGRAFFVSDFTSDAQLRRVPRYYATTYAGDAIWVPTWTWHRVDYYGSNENNDEHDEQEVAIGASLFHLRPTEFVCNNPLFAFLVMPNLIKEILKINTQ